MTLESSNANTLEEMDVLWYELLECVSVTYPAHTVCGRVGPRFT